MIVLRTIYISVYVIGAHLP